MNILILQGPNLNLLGLKSSKRESRLTLDKLNKQIRSFSKDSEISIKTLQTHKKFQAINFYKEIEIGQTESSSYQHLGQETVIQYLKLSISFK